MSHWHIAFMLHAALAGCSGEDLSVRLGKGWNGGGSGGGLRVTPDIALMWERIDKWYSIVDPRQVDVEWDERQDVAATVRPGRGRAECQELARGLEVEYDRVFPALNTPGFFGGRK